MAAEDLFLRSLADKNETGNPTNLRLRSASDKAAPSVSSSPSAVNLGIVAPGATYYAKGSAPNNPVQDSDCTFTITNTGSVAIDISIVCTDFSGGVGWVLSSTPGTNEVKLIAYYSGQNPASGVVLTTSPQSFYVNLAAGAHFHFDFSLIAGSDFTDGVPKSSTITLSASAA